MLDYVNTVNSCLFLILQESKKCLSTHQLIISLQAEKAWNKESLLLGMRSRTFYYFTIIRIKVGKLARLENKSYCKWIVVCLKYWAFPVPETICIRWTSQWQRGKYNVAPSGSVELGSRAPLRLDTRGRRGRGLTWSPSSSCWAAGGRETGALTEGQQQHSGKIQNKVIACSVLNQMSLN